MRRLYWSDLEAACAALLALPAEARTEGASALLAEAHAADRYARRFGRAHPRWGDGSLMAAARARTRAPAPPPASPELQEALAALLAALASRRMAVQPRPAERAAGGRELASRVARSPV
jgi:hypothetical protein